MNDELEEQEGEQGQMMVRNGRSGNTTIDTLIMLHNCGPLSNPQEEIELESEAVKIMSCKANVLLTQYIEDTVPANQVWE